MTHIQIAFIRLHEHRRAIWSAVFMLIFVLLPSGAFAQNVSLLDSISVKSDDNLNSARIACAFGDMPKTFADTRSRGVKTPDVTTYCVMVTQEAAKRDRMFHLYSRMQPGKAGDEWSLILAASGRGQSSYINVQNTEKILNCELERFLDNPIRQDSTF